jgi:hypothetical protein
MCWIGQSSMVLGIWINFFGLSWTIKYNSGQCLKYTWSYEEDYVIHVPSSFIFVIEFYYIYKYKVDLKVI